MQNTAIDLVSDAGQLADKGLRGRVEAGLQFANDNGYSFAITGNYDGIGDDDFEAWGVGATLGYRW